MVSLARKLQILAYGPNSQHDKLFNEHGYSRISRGSNSGQITHTYFAKPGSKQNLSGIHKHLRAQGYKSKRSGENRSWTKGKHTVSYNAQTQELKHEHPEASETKASESNSDIINYAKGIISALEGDLTYPKTAIENAKAIIRAVQKTSNPDDDKIGHKPIL